MELQLPLQDLHEVGHREGVFVEFGAEDNVVNFLYSRWSQGQPPE